MSGITSNDRQCKEELRLWLGIEVVTEMIERLGNGKQCRFNHGPNGPVARAPELKGAPRAPKMIFVLS